jgi:hypothetical protein
VWTLNAVYLATSHILHCVHAGFDGLVEGL